MSNSPHLTKTVKGRPITVSLHNLYEFMDSVEKHREGGEVKFFEYIESLEKRSEEREAKLQIELKSMLHNKFTSFQEEIQKQ